MQAMEELETPPYVLLVDTYKEEIKKLSAFFAAHGWKYDVTSDCETALKASRSQQYDVVITDLSIPGHDGRELLHHFREQNPSQAVIVLTKDGSAEKAVEILRQGAVDLFSRPIDLQYLEETIARVVAGVRERAEEAEFYNYLEETSLSFSINSATAAKVKVHPDVLEKLYACGRIDLNEKLRLTLAFQEAFTNALDHGNLELDSRWREEVDHQGLDLYSLRRKERIQDPKYGQRMLKVLVSLKNDVLRIAIEDEGPGFQPAQNASEDKSPDGFSCYGRGLSIMTAATDSLKYEKSGRRVIMTKRLGDQK